MSDRRPGLTAIVVVSLASLLLVACSSSASTTTTTKQSQTTTSFQDTTDVDDNGVTTINEELLRADLSALPIDTLTEFETSGLLYIAEEEKLAHDVYTVLYDKWQLPIFANIATSEQTHVDAVSQLLERHQIDDPTIGEPAGVFTDPDLQKAYDDLVAKGGESLEAALQAGAQVEEMDLFDLQQQETNTPDVALVYANLEKGSRNHLRAFVDQLDRRGFTYVPTFLSEEDYNDIVSSPMERGPSA